MSRQCDRERVILLFRKEGPAVDISIVAVMEYANTSNLRKKGLISTPSSRASSITSGKATTAGA